MFSNFIGRTLSRRAYGVFQGFVELYDTLFFLCSLGRKTLDFVRAAHPNSISWLVFGFAQVMAERVLVLAVPIVNLCLLAIATVLLPALFGHAQIVLVCLGSLDVLAALVCDISHAAPDRPSTEGFGRSCSWQCV